MIRGRILDAMLEACGEKGFRRVTVQDVIDRYGGYRMQFYQHFRSKADCYAAAYEAAMAGLASQILERSSGHTEWASRIRAGLEELARFVCDDPARARGLFVEVHLAGEGPLARRQELIDTFCRKIDCARQLRPSRHPPPPLTSLFMIGAVESAVTAALAAGEPARFAAAVPELARMIVVAYLGDQVDDLEFESVPA